jgi:hypothetical protein
LDKSMRKAACLVTPTSSRREASLAFSWMGTNLLVSGSEAQCRFIKTNKAIKSKEKKCRTNLISFMQIHLS